MIFFNFLCNIVEKWTKKFRICNYFYKILQNIIYFNRGLFYYVNMNGNIFNLILYDLKSGQDFHKRATEEVSQLKFGNDPTIAKYLYEKYFTEDSEER